MHHWLAIMATMQSNGDDFIMAVRNVKALLLILSVFILLAIYIIISKFNIVSAVSLKINSIKSPKSTVYYTETSNKILNNPYIGLVPGADASAVYYPFSMVYVGVSWKELEPEKGKYDFEKFEEKYKFNYWKQKGVKFVMRIYMDYPSKEKHMDIPDWLYNEIGKDGYWYNSDGNQGFSPNYRNKTLMENHKRLIKAFADRYGNDTSVAFIELGSVGHWGEWHVTYIPYEKNAFPKTDVTDIYVNDYLENFKNKKLLIRRPFGIASDNNMGLFNDAFGDITQTEKYFINWINNGYDDHNVDQYHDKMPDFWKAAPSGGEFANYPGEIYIEDNNIDRTISMIKNSHTSWLGPSLPVYNKLSEDKKKNLEKLVNLMGYHFNIAKSTYLDKLLPGQTQKGSIQIDNTGVAPFYFEWPMYVSMYDSLGNEIDKIKLNYDIRNLLPGESEITYEYSLKGDLTAGVYDLRLFIEDPDTGNPAIEFANIGVGDKKEYPIGSFNVKLP